MTYRIRNIAIAIALAVVAALLTTFYVTNYKRTVQSEEKSVGVFVASRDIPDGTAGSEVAASNWIAQRTIPRRSVVPGAISNPSQIEDDVATEPIYAGEQITTRRFRPVEERGIRAELKGNMRALQIPGDKDQLLAGTLMAGDRVDVVASIKYRFVNFRPTRKSKTTDDLVASRVVLRDLRVLRAAEAPAESTKLTGSSQAASVILAVTDSQAQKLFFVMKNGDWSLQLRPPVKAADSPESVETVGSVLGDGLHGAQFDQLIFGTRGR
jgi:Flp pilus assembly protein CpaB